MILLCDFAGEPQTPPKRGRASKRGRPFSKNLPGRAEAVPSMLKSLFF